MSKKNPLVVDGTCSNCKFFVPLPKVTLLENIIYSSVRDFRLSLRQVWLVMVLST
jgi:hypothetical protein